MKNIIAVISLAAVISGCSTMGSAPSGQGYHSNSSENKVAYFPSKRETNGHNTFVFKPNKMAWAAYDADGNRVRVGKASGGVDSCPETGGNCRTVTGEFRVQRKGDEACASKKYPLGVGGAPMPYCMYFHGGYAIHGSNYVPDVPASHGCIRVETSQAAWLNHEFLNVGSPVVVESY